MALLSSFVPRRVLLTSFLYFPVFYFAYFAPISRKGGQRVCLLASLLNPFPGSAFEWISNSFLRGVYVRRERIEPGILPKWIRRNQVINKKKETNTGENETIRQKGKRSRLRIPESIVPPRERNRRTAVKETASRTIRFPFPSFPFLLCLLSLCYFLTICLSAFYRIRTFTYSLYSAFYWRENLLSSDDRRL